MIVEPKLVKKVKKKDKKAFEKIFNMTYSSAMLIAIKTTNNKLDAEDIVQDAYIQVLKNINLLQDDSKFVPWFNKIVVNKCYEYLRKKQPILFSEDDKENIELNKLVNEDINFNPEDYFDYNETMRYIDNILAVLPDDQRLCIMMYYYNEMSINEISELLNVSNNTVKSRLNYGRKKIRIELEKLEKEGVKLYNVAPMKLVLWILNKEKNDITIVSKKKVEKGVISSLSTKSISESAVATTGVLTAKNDAITKMIAITITGVIVCCGAYGAKKVIGSKKNNMKVPIVTTMLKNAKENKNETTVTETTFIETTTDLEPEIKIVKKKYNSDFDYEYVDVINWNDKNEKQWNHYFKKRALKEIKSSIDSEATQGSIRVASSGIYRNIISLSTYEQYCYEDDDEVNITTYNIDMRTGEECKLSDICDLHEMAEQLTDKKYTEINSLEGSSAIELEFFKLSPTVFQNGEVSTADSWLMVLEDIDSGHSPSKFYINNNKLVLISDCMSHYRREIALDKLDINKK